MALTFFDFRVYVRIDLFKCRIVSKKNMLATSANSRVTGLLAFSSVVLLTLILCP